MSSQIGLYSVKKGFMQGEKKLQVLDNVNLKLTRGKWYTIYGVSGSGKTTLLHTIGGLEKPDEGAITHNGRDVYAMQDKTLSRWRNEKIGFVFQLFHLIPELDVRDNIVLPAVAGRIRLDSGWLDNIASLLDIKRLFSRSPTTLSGGEQQRVALARALINRPDFIIADEPTGNLDAASGSSVIELMKSMRDRSGAGIVLATHNRDIYAGDRQYVLKEGNIFEEDSI